MSENAKKSDSKIKTIFDHIKHLRAVGEYEYFDSLSDDDKKSWSNFMAIRILSMHFELLEIVNIIQRYHYLSPELAETPKKRIPYLARLQVIWCRRVPQLFFL